MNTDSAEQDFDDGLEWLLDQELEEPEETLFAVDVDENGNGELSAEEAMLASRPMSGSSGQGDVFSSLFDEEILLSSDHEEQGAGQDEGAGDVGEALMTVDHTRKSSAGVVEKTVADDEEGDILELSENDDIGERYLVLRKRKAEAASPAAEPPAPTGTEAAPPAPEQGAPVQAPTASVDSVTDMPSADPVSGGFEIDSAVLSELDNLDFGASSVETPDKEAQDHESQDLDVVADQSIETAGDSDFDDLGLGDFEADIDLSEDVQDGSLAILPESDDVDAIMAMDLVEIIDQGGTTVDEPQAEEPLELQADVDDVTDAVLSADGGTDDASQPDVARAGEQPEELAEVQAEVQLEDETLELPELDAEPTEAAAETTAEVVEEAASTATDAKPPAEYITSYTSGGDDEAFDEFLLQGENLAAAELDPADLEVSPMPGVTGVDPTPEQGIDYHEDFRAMAALETQSLAELAPRLGAIMVALEQEVSERLQALGREPGEVLPQLVLIQSPEDLQEYASQSYAPLHEVFPTLPLTLAELEQGQRDALYLRLFNAVEDRSENALFLESPADDVAPQGEVAAADLELAGADLPELEFDGVDAEPMAPQVSSLLDVTPDAEEALDQVFDEIDSDAAALVEEESDTIFDASVFDEDLEGGWDDVPTSSAAAASGATEAPQASADLDAAFDALSGEAADAHLDEALLAEAAGSLDQEEPVAESVFDDELFDADLSDELLAAGAGENSNIDALIDSLGGTEGSDDDVYGIEAEAFADDQETESTAVPEPEPARAEPVEQTGSLAWAIPSDIDFHRGDPAAGEMFAEFLDAFIEEGALELEKLEAAIEAWEAQVDSDAAFAPVGRILHTLKGIAKGVGLHLYGTLIHNFETLLEAMPKPVQGAEQEYFRIVSAWLDAAVGGFEHISESRSDIAGALPGQTLQAEAPAAAIEEETAPAVAEDEVAQPEPANTLETRNAERERQRDQQLADEGAKALAAQQTVRITSEKLDHLLNLTNQAQQLGVRSSQSVVRSKAAGTELEARLSSVRAHIAKIADRALLNVTATGNAPTGELDALEMDQYSELQEAANILREAVEDLNDLVSLSSRQNSLVETLLKQQSGVMASLGASLQSARVIPVSRLMPGLRRIVRTVSTDLGKTVTFKVLGEVGSLDRDNYSRCQIILEHMVRNALDHGIESPEDRLVAGKPTAGRISIDVRKDGGDYLVTLADDGRGIDPDMMREVAYDKGLDVDVDELTDEEAQRLIFHKGFSTASAVSQISGRGVGMDIVLSELQQVGGNIDIRSTVGQGTTFEIRIPSNVTVNGALHVTAGGTAYAIPLDGLIAVEQVEVERFFEAVENGATLQLDELDCEPAYLAALCSGDSLPDRGTWSETVPVIIAGDSSRAMAIAVDDVTQALELVIRSLGPQFSNVPGLAGAATTADGSAIVALDLNALVHSTSGREVSIAGREAAEDDHLLVLVVDDSRTQRMVATSQFDTVGVETITAENGMVAIDLLNTTHRLPDVVLLDVEMPVKDGIQTLREIRKSTRYQHLPVIMVTSRTGAKHRALAEEAGCNGYMGKPFNFPELVTQINELTGHNLQLG